MAHSIITEIGPMVPDFKEENVLILFGPMATPDLREICVIHEFEQPPAQSLVAGQSFSLGEHQYTIVQVGSEANKNFEALGHISIYFKPSDDGLLPGAIEVTPPHFPSLAAGDKIIF